MLVSDLIKSVRISIDDTNGTRYSDFSCLDTVNSVFGGLVNLLNKHNSELLYKEVTLTMVNDSCELPADFVKPVSVSHNGEEIACTTKLTNNGYKIIGNVIKSKLASLDLVYAYCFPDKVTASSTVPFPAYFESYLKKYIVMVLTNNNADASITILPVMEADIVAIVNDRGHADIDRELPFQI